MCLESGLKTVNSSAGEVSTILLLINKSGDHSSNSLIKVRHTVAVLFDLDKAFDETRMYKILGNYIIGSSVVT